MTDETQQSVEAKAQEAEVNTELTPAPEGEPGTPTGQDTAAPQEKPKRKSPAKERINQLTRKRHEAEREAERLRKEW